MENEIKSLIVRFKSGDEKAFEEILETYSGLISALSSRYEEKCRIYGAEYDDICQEAKLALYKAAMTFDLEKEGITFGLYSKICIKNRLISVQRKFIRANNKSKSVIKGGPSSAQGTRAVISEEDKQKLTIFERDVITLYLEGCSYKEIAEKLQRNVKSVDNAMFRIRKKVRGSHSY